MRKDTWAGWNNAPFPEDLNPCDRNDYRGFLYLVPMMRTFLLSCGTIFLFHGLWSQVPGPDPHWNLVFEEQFDSLDPAIWKVAHHFDHYGEPQVYTNRNDNVFVSDGELVLRVKKERYRCRELYGWACNKSWYDYTSGWVETRKEFNALYGYIESRIRIPYGFGFWPAFWTFIGEDVTGKHNAAEIDIFEMLGTQPPTVMGTNLHIAYCNCLKYDCGCDFLNDYRCPQVDSSILCHGLDVEIPDYSEQFNTYAVEWSPSKILWYVNGKVVRISANPGIVDPVRIIFNLAITPWNLPDESTPFPSSMRIDFLRIYEPLADDESIDSCTVDFSEYDWQVKKEITIGGEGCSNEIPVGEDITLRATDGIEIRGDFTVPLGAQLYLDVNEVNEINKKNRNP
jgi:beta-glucanase (GH16 family)